MKDKLGKQVEVGDIVAVAYGGLCWGMYIGVISKIRTNEDGSYRSATMTEQRTKYPKIVKLQSDVVLLEKGSPSKKPEVG